MKRHTWPLIMLVIALVLAMSASYAFAATNTDATSIAPDTDTAVEGDSAGIVMESGDTSSPSGLTYGNDWFWAGSSLTSTSSTVEGDAFLAGQYLTVYGLTASGSLFIAGQKIDIKNSATLGSVRAAGQTISIEGSTILHNITAAGEDISIDAATVCRGLYLSGSRIYYSGTCDSLVADGGTVAIGGTVNGDAEVSGDHITIADDAVITGTLHVSSTSEPVIPATAQVGNYEFTHVSSSENSADSASSLVSGFGTSFSIGHALFLLVSFLIIALLFYWLARPNLTQAGAMLKEHPAPMLVSGLIVMIVAPLLIAILAVLLLTIRIAIVMLCLCVAISLFMSPFSGAAIGQLIFKKMSPLLASLIGAAIMAVLVVIPFVGGIASLFAGLFTLGYCIQWLWRNRIRKTGTSSVPDTTV